MSPRLSPSLSRPAPTLQRPLAIAALQACCLASLSATGLQAMAQQARDGAALPVAQTAADNNATESTLPGTTVSAPANRQARAGISGLGDTPGWQAPVQAQTFGQTVLRDAGITRLADLIKLDASLTDAYNAIGYWDSMNVRGYKLDNTLNYRREGLPISGETRIALDNKAGIELFKGTSGMQAGTSAPSGLVNYVVKRPDVSLREVTLGLNDRGGWLMATDLSERFGQQREFGLRVNAAHEDLRPTTQAADGRRRLAAVAGDWRLTPDARLEAEFEHSFLTQPSVPGYSLLGRALPSAKALDPTTNFNNQAWSRPVEMQGNTGSLRWSQNWGKGWRSQVSYGEQRLQSTDQGAFTFGCGAEGNYAAHCSNGTFDLYDFRSPGEHRRTRAWLASLQGRVETGIVRHDLTLGALRSRHDTDMQQAAYNYAGEGNITGQFTTPEAPLPLDYANTLRSERSTEFSVVDALSHDGPWRAWVGLRHTQLQRDTELTDTSANRSASLDESVTTGWAAIGYQLAEQTQAYVSWGQGIEATAAQNPAPSTFIAYTNAGQVLPTRRSRQLEVGLKSAAGGHQWGVNAFQIHRPVADRITQDDGLGGILYTYLNDGEAVHRGIETSWQWRSASWQTSLAGALLDTERRGSQRTDVNVNGKPATNVPEHTLRASVAWRVPGLESTWLQTDVIHEGPRAITADNSLRLSSWTRTDLGLRTATTLAGSNVVWRLNVHNLFNLRNWREAPTYSDHVYLMPQAARSVSATASVSF
ncbi:MAG: TonB-dependent receptor [Gammaproteobacteria bacterium]|nr:TonB-dependent receptor [Gammaproteobacteria bacterium]